MSERVEMIEAVAASVAEGAALDGEPCPGGQWLVEAVNDELALAGLDALTPADFELAQAAAVRAYGWAA